MAQVRVDVARKPSKHGPFARLLHWADHRVMGVVMGTAAFVLERLVLRGTKKANAKSGVHGDAAGAGESARGDRG